MAKQWFKTKCDTKSMMNNLELQYECQICKTKFDSPQTLNKHMLECNPPKTYTFRSSRQKSKKSNCKSKNCFKLDCDNKCNVLVESRSVKKSIESNKTSIESNDESIGRSKPLLTLEGGEMTFNSNFR